MSRKVVMAITLIAVILMTTPLVLTTQAKEVIETDMGSYTEYIGSLSRSGDGTGFAFLKPKTWNGKLVIFCKARSYKGNDPKAYVPPYTVGTEFASMGYAFAYNTYGEGGYPIKNAIIRTHQLTEWLIDNYEISDKIYLCGYSMGGNVALLLAEKYPDLYDGVLDCVGPKNMKRRYNDWIGLPDPKGILPALEAECGGTPEEKPKAYEKRSPTYNADIKIPIISLYGTADVNVPPIQAELFYDAVEAAGSLDYYRCYMYSGYGHGSFWFLTNPVAFYHFMDLVNWVENGIDPYQTQPVPYPIPPP